jgi:hypothetical protein
MERCFPSGHLWCWLWSNHCEARLEISAHTGDAIPAILQPLFPSLFKLLECDVDRLLNSTSRWRGQVPNLDPGRPLISVGRPFFDVVSTTVYGRILDTREGTAMKGRLTFAIAVALTPSAIAGQATMGDVSLNLPAPAGFCEMGETNPSDKYMLTTTANLLARRQ